MSILFCGDVSASAVKKDVWNGATAETLFTDVVDLFHSANRVVVNLECALTERETVIRKFGPNLKMPICAAAILRDAGVTDCGLSNNHSVDFDEVGLADTIATLESAGLGWTGAGKNEADSRKDLIFTENGKTVRVITVCEHEYTYAMENVAGARPYDPYDTSADIRKAKAEADYVVVMYHGGKEYSRYPSPRLRKLCRSMVTDGADLVLCQHSHCIGCREKYENGEIVYGQGNFHFLYDDRDGTMWAEGLAVRVTLDDAVSIEYIPVIEEENHIRLMNGAEKTAVLADFEKRSHDLETEAWLDGWREFCAEMKPRYESAVAGFHTGEERDVHLFAHYLDCEAHTDVWRELYKTWHRAKGN